MFNWRSGDRNRMGWAILYSGSYFSGLIMRFWEFSACLSPEAGIFLNPESGGQLMGEGTSGAVLQVFVKFQNGVQLFDIIHWVPPLSHGI